MLLKRVVQLFKAFIVWVMLRLLAETCEDTRMKPTGHRPQATGYSALWTSTVKCRLLERLGIPNTPFEKKNPFESDSKSRDERYYDS